MAYYKKTFVTVECASCAKPLVVLRSLVRAYKKKHCKITCSPFCRRSLRAKKVKQEAKDYKASLYL